MRIYSKNILSFLSSRTAGLSLILLVIGLGFGLTDANFRDPLNLLDRSRHWVEIGLMAIPMTFIIATSGIDLSVGSILGMSGIVAGLCFRDLQWPLWAALGMALAVGTAGGALNGLASSAFRLPPLVVTLATLALYRGVAMGLSKANPVSDFPLGFTEWGSMGAVGGGRWEVPQQFLLLLALVAVGELFFRKSRLGRWSVQIGENPTAARFAAVPVGRVILILYTLSGAVAGLAAILFIGRFATALPEAGTGWELEVIAAVVIGGTRITGGSGSVAGTFLGVLILGLLRFGMDMRGVVQQYQILLVGVLVVATAIMNEYLARRREARR